MPGFWFLGNDKNNIYLETPLNVLTAMIRLQTIFTCTIIILVLNACTVEKRHYRKGFYIAAKKQKNLDTKSLFHSQHHNSTENNIASEPIAFNSRVPSGLASVSSSPPALNTHPEQSILQNQACDTLFLKDGSKITAVLREIGYKDIRYKLCDFTEGPDYLVEKFRVLSVHYSNGKQETFISEEPPPPPAYKQGTDNRKIYAGNEKNSNAALSLAFGILGFYPLPVIGSIIGIVFGIVARNEVVRYPGRYSNQHMANIGLTVSIATMLFWLMLIVYVLVI